MANSNHGSGQAITLAVAGPLSGSSARLGTEMAQATRLAIEEQNARGGILGMKVGVDVADDRGDVRTGADLARGYCDRPEVLGVIGHYNSDVTLAASSIYDAAGLAMVTPIASNPRVTERGLPAVFRFTNRDDRTGLAIAWHLSRTLGKQRAVIVLTPTAYGTSMADSFADALIALGGRVVTRERVEEGRRDFTALVRTLPPAFDVLFYGGSFEGAYILRALRAAGLDQVFAAGDGCWDVANFLEPAGDAAEVGEGVLILAASTAVGRVPGSADFASRYTQRFGPIVNYALNSYDSTRMLLDAINRSAGGSGRRPSRGEVVDALRRATFQGIAYAGRCEWDDKNDNRAAVTVLNVVEKGRYREVAETARG